MIPILTTAQMRAIDVQAIGGDRASGFSYMLKAGMGLYDAVLEFVKPGDKIAIVCGKGNNGGDGYVVGRMLLDEGYRVMCYALADGDSLRGEAYQAYTEYVSAKGNVMMVDDVADLDAFGGYGVIIDAILGTGLKGDPRGMAADVIAAINRSGVPVVSVDTPSGLNNDTGVPGTPTVRSAVTVTMGFPKIGQLVYPAREFVGRLVIKDLGYPEEIVARNQGGVYAPRISRIARLIPPRKPAGSKFDHGLALIAAGSQGMTGSATLAAMAALRTGCGMAHMASPRSAVSLLSLKLTEPVIHPMAETEEGTIAREAVAAVLDLEEKMHAALIGPGLSHMTATSAFCRELLKRLRIPAVLDADGINAFRGRAEELRERDCELIITPHAGEWARLFDPLPEAIEPKLRRLAEVARDFGMHIVYKGNPTLIASAAGAVWIAALGNSGMASAGAGDVLSGVLVSLLAQGCAPADTAVLGAVLHGLAGERASAARTAYGMIASDMIEAIPAVLRELVPPAPAGVRLDGMG
jgi:NAD(P)H-hydrate epimerase